MIDSDLTDDSKLLIDVKNTNENGMNHSKKSPQKNLSSPVKKKDYIQDSSVLNPSITRAVLIDSDQHSDHVNDEFSHQLPVQSEPDPSSIQDMNKSKSYQMNPNNDSSVNIDIDDIKFLESENTIIDVTTRQAVTP